MTSRVRKAVFPVAGLGTRFLPATKAMPKEMLPVVDKPLIQYAVEEAQSRRHRAIHLRHRPRARPRIEDHFDRAYELEDDADASAARTRELNELAAPGCRRPARSPIRASRRRSASAMRCWCARHLVGDEPFAVLLADDLMLAQKPLPEADGRGCNDQTGGNIVAVDGSAARADQPLRRARHRATMTASWCGSTASSRSRSPRMAPSTLTIIGRYILQPEVFDHLAQHRPRRRRRDPADRRAGTADRRQQAVPRPALRRAALRLRRQARLSRSQYRLRARAPRMAPSRAHASSRIPLSTRATMRGWHDRRPSLRPDHPARIRHSRHCRRDAARGRCARHRPRLRRGARRGRRQARRGRP